MTQSVWCVKDRNGRWCAVKDGKEPKEGITSIETECGMFIILPGGIDRCRPSCPECAADAAVLRALDRK